MKLASQYEFSEAQNDALVKARRIEYLTIAYLCSVITLMYVVMGSSQAMKTAWIEDCLSLIPPICFLIGARICWRKPTNRYPYGYHRVVSVLFLCASLALLFMGAYLLFDAVMTLAKREHPNIGMKTLFGHDMWLGWWMILILLWGTFPPIILGLFKVKYARTLQDKILITDGKMNKADWMTAVAAIGGVLGIGLGWWWADAIAAGLISFDILKDGWTQSKDAVSGLMNRAPTSVDGEYLDLPEKAQNTLLKYDWIEDAQIRLFEHGHLFYGEGFIKILNDEEIHPDKLRRAMKEIRALDWRLQGFALSVDYDDCNEDNERQCRISE